MWVIEVGGGGAKAVRAHNNVMFRFMFRIETHRAAPVARHRRLPCFESKQLDASVRRCYEEDVISWRSIGGVDYRVEARPSL